MKAIRNDFKNYSAADYQTFTTNPEIEKMFLKSALVRRIFAENSWKFQENVTRKRAEVEAREYQLWAHDWQFKLNEISCNNLVIYNGSEDFGTTKEVRKRLEICLT